VVAAGRDSVAILVADGQTPKALKMGKEVAPGVTVTEVHARYVMLSEGGVLKRIDLATDAKAGPNLTPPVGMDGGMTGQQLQQQAMQQQQMQQQQQQMQQQIQQQQLSPQPPPDQGGVPPPPPQMQMPAPTRNVTSPGGQPPTQ
jgi:general secretion pathway protein C